MITFKENLKLDDIKERKNLESELDDTKELEIALAKNKISYRKGKSYLGTIDDKKFKSRLDSSHLSGDTLKSIIILVEKRYPEFYVEPSKFEYLGGYSGINYVLKRNYETYDIFAVDGKLLEIIKIWDNPFPNKKGNLIFNRQNGCSLVFEDCPKGFQIWENRDQSLKKLIEIKLTGIFIIGGEWVNDNELIVYTTDVLNFVYFNKKIYKIQPFKLSIN